MAYRDADTNANDDDANTIVQNILVSRGDNASSKSDARSGVTGT